MESIEKKAWAVAALLALSANSPTVLWAHEGETHEKTAIETRDLGHVKKKRAKAKISAAKNKQLKAVFPEARSFAVKRYSLSKKQVSAIQKKLKGRLKRGDKRARIFKALGRKKKALGTVVFFGAKDVDDDSIPAAVGIGLDGRIENVIVFSHHDDNPWAEEEWLSQFIGMSAKDDWHPGHTITLIEDYDQPSWQTAKGIRKALLINQAVAGVPGARKAKTHDHEAEGGHGDHAH